SRSTMTNTTVATASSSLAWATLGTFNMRVGRKNILFGLEASIVALGLVSVFSSAASEPFAALPLFFEPGQTAAGVSQQFLARGLTYQFWSPPTEVQFALQKGENLPSESPAQRHHPAPAAISPTRVTRMLLLGANQQARLSSAEEFEGKVNYLIGNDPEQW